MQPILFCTLSFAIFFFALLVITSRNPVNAAIFLILVFFFISALFVLLHAFFLAAVQILVYAGAIMVLFLFVIMLLNIPQEMKRKFYWLNTALSVLVFFALIAEFIALICFHSHFKYHPPQLIGTTEAIGRLLFTKYLLPFEVTSLTLLVAMIGVIILSKQKEK